MKFALFGYGKMGKLIAQTALKRGHSIIEKIDSKTIHFDIAKADVAIDFSVPSSALKNISLCLAQHIPVVSGTTGWLNEYPQAVALCNEKNGAFLHASNFSLGVNLFFQLNRYLANVMKGFPEYHVSIEEIHHAQKLDAPSGTAIILAEAIIENTSKTRWMLSNEDTKAKDDEIPIAAKRIGNVTGTHRISYTSAADTIEITHTAHHREGFALGAVIAAEWIIGKKGVYTMQDVLKS